MNEATPDSVPITPAKAKFWKAADDRVLVEAEPLSEKRTANGLVLPERVGAGVRTGTVIAVGPKADGPKVGDKAMFLLAPAKQVEGNVYSVYASDILALTREE